MIILILDPFEIMPAISSRILWPGHIAFLSVFAANLIAAGAPYDAGQLRSTTANGEKTVNIRVPRAESDGLVLRREGGMFSARKENSCYTRLS